jgi:hypothetical protein
VYVVLDERPTGEHTTDQSPDRTTELIATLREQLAAERQAHAEARRLLAAALERIPAIEALSDEREVSAGSVSEEQTVRETDASAPNAARANPHVADPFTMLFFAAGAGVAAGVANPLIIVRTDNLFWLPILLLWVLPPIFGYWLGRSFAFLRVEAFAALETLRQERMHIREGSEQAVSLDARINYWENRTEPVITPLYAMFAGLLTVVSSILVTLYIGIDPLRSWLVVAVQGVVAFMLILFMVQAGFGFTRQRLEREQAQRNVTSGGSVAPSAGNRQAYIGLIGAIITTVGGLIGALLTALLPLFFGGGATGG